LIILFLRVYDVPNTNSETNNTVLSTEIPQHGFHIFYSAVLCVMKELYCSLPYDLLACLSNGDIRQVAMAESSPQRTGLQPLTSSATLPSQQ
jgi:hypothetical protein